MKKPKLRISRLRVDVHQHGVLSKKVTLQVSVIGIRQEDLASFNPDDFGRDIINAATAYLQEKYEIEIAP